MGPTEKLDLRTTQSDIAVLEEKGFILDKIIGEGSYAKVSGPIYRIRKITFLLYYQDVPARVYSSNCLRRSGLVLTRPPARRCELIHFI